MFMIGLPQKAVDEFKQLSKQEFNIELSDDEARDRATKFLNLMNLISKPIPTDK